MRQSQIRLPLKVVKTTSNYYFKPKHILTLVCSIHTVVHISRNCVQVSTLFYRDGSCAGDVDMAPSSEKHIHTPPARLTLAVEVAKNLEKMRNQWLLDVCLPVICAHHPYQSLRLPRRLWRIKKTPKLRGADLLVPSGKRFCRTASPREMVSGRN